MNNDINIVGMPLRFDSCVFGMTSKMDVSSIEGHIISNYKYFSYTWIDIYNVEDYNTIHDVYEEIIRRESVYKNSVYAHKKPDEKKNLIDEHINRVQGNLLN